MKRYAPAVVFLVSALLPVVAMAYFQDSEARAQINLQFRRCEAAAYDVEIAARIETYATYHEQYRANLEQYREEIRAARELEDSRESSDAQKQAEKGLQERQADIRKQLDEELRNARRELDNARRECRRTKDEAIRELSLVERYQNAVCSTDSQCGNSGMLTCSTSQGVCNRNCSNPDTCTAICKGTCVRTDQQFSFESNTTVVAQASNSQTSAQVETNSSVSTSTTPTSCQPYICNDGTQFPSCTPEGLQIFYFMYPCQYHNGGSGGPY